MHKIIISIHNYATAAQAAVLLVYTGEVVRSQVGSQWLHQISRIILTLEHCGSWVMIVTGS